jgi:hypothetical protein
MVFKNNVVRKTFGAGGWRKLYSEELHYLYFSPNVVWVIRLRRMRWVGHVAHMGVERNTYRVLVGKPEGKRPLGRLRVRWDGRIEIGHKEIGWQGMDRIHLAQDVD